MAVRFRVRKIETRNSYTMEQLYMHIRKHSFTAGQPSLSRYDLTDVITFPPLDAHHQVWITQAQLGKAPYRKWQVYINTPVSGTACSTALLRRFRSFITRQAGMLVEKTAEELSGLGL